MLIADGELCGVNSDSKTSRACGDVITSECFLAAFVEPAIGIEGEGVRGDDSAAGKELEELGIDFDSHDFLYEVTIEPRFLASLGMTRAQKSSKSGQRDFRSALAWLAFRRRARSSQRSRSPFARMKLAACRKAGMLFARC